MIQQDIDKNMTCVTSLSQLVHMLWITLASCSSSSAVKFLNKGPSWDFSFVLSKAIVFKKQILIVYDLYSNTLLICLFQGLPSIPALKRDSIIFTCSTFTNVQIVHNFQKLHVR